MRFVTNVVYIILIKGVLTHIKLRIEVNVHLLSSDFQLNQTMFYYLFRKGRGGGEDKEGDGSEMWGVGYKEKFFVGSADALKHQLIRVKQCIT